MPISPGPWKLDKRGEQLLSSDNRKVIVWNSGLAFGNRTPETEANAKAIMILPELLQIAQTLNDWYEQQGCNGNGPSGSALLFDDDATLCTHIREALEKAGIL